MAQFPDNWVRVFDIPETNKHVKGFTIYKIVSILYPKTCPDAVTKVTVWKRYNDFKKLHRELKSRYKCLKIKENYPTLVSSSYFKRFDPEIINDRRKNALAYLEFVAQYPPLFKAIEFVKFFESSHTPQDALNSNINIIRAQLNLPGEPEITLCNSEEDVDHSDSDTISTFSSVSGTAIKDEVGSPEQNSSSSILEETKTLGASNSNISKISSHDSSSIHSFVDLTTEIVRPTSPVPESLQLECSSQIQYLTNAAQHITQAAECEIDKKYEEAFNSYKLAISCLLTGVKDDKDSKRRQMVRHKTEIYLLRAEKIYNLHLSPEISQIRDSIQRTEFESSILTFSTKRPVAELFDYKVLKVIDKGLVVLHKKEQNIFYMKVIEKNPQTPSTIYFNIPKDVPYMVKLHQYYDCFHSVFIVTEYIQGEKLFDHIKQKSLAHSENSIQYSKVTFEREMDQDSGNCDEINSDSSECSYSDLIQNYTSKNITDQPKSAENLKDTEKIDIKSVSDFTDSDPTFVSDETFLKLSNSTGDLVKKSKKLISSVSDTLLEQKSKEEFPIKNTHSENAVCSKTVQRQSSEVSLTEEFSIVHYISPLSDVIKWASQILLALEKLHHCGIVVMDLNPRKLLLDDDDNIKLTYIFNFQETNKIFYTNFEDNFYLAPEVLSPQTVTFAADWWSYGVILYELLTGIPLSLVHFEGMKKYTLLKIPKYVSPEGKSLLRQLLVYEPQDRLGCGKNGTEDLKSHPFFNGVDWEKLSSSAYN